MNLIASMVEENRWSQLDNTWHKARLDKLEIEPARCVVAEDSAIVGEVDLEVVLRAESLRVNRLRH